MFAYLTNGNRIFFEDKGNSDKSVILIHHLAGSVNSWKYVVPKLSEKFRVITYDLRGHGRSSVPPNPYRIEDHSDDLKRLIEELNIKEPLLIGHSIGSLIAIDFALKYYVKKIILLGALYKAPAPDPYLKYVSIAMNLGMIALAEYRRNQGEFSDALINNPVAWKSLVSVYKENTPIGYKYAVDGLLMAKDYSSELSKIESKVYLIYGDNDKLSVNIPVFQNNLKNLSINILKGYGHFLNFEAPDDLSDLLVKSLMDDST